MFSVVIPLYNKEQTIARAIDSILAQSLQAFEIIVVDDGSTDEGVRVVQSFEDHRIHLLSQPNQGVSSARNQGIAMARYEWIAFLDADDAWTPEHLEEMRRLKVCYPEAKLLASNYTIVDPSGQTRSPIDTTQLGISGERGVLCDYFLIASKMAPPLWTGAVVVERESLCRVGCFPLGVGMGEDLLAWAKLAIAHPIAYSKNATAYYHFKALDELIAEEPLPPAEDRVGTQLKQLLPHAGEVAPALRSYLSLWHRMRATLYLNNNDPIATRRELFKAIGYDKWRYKSYVILLLSLLPSPLRVGVMRLRRYLASRSLS